MEEDRKAQVYGVRPTRSFREAATKYLNEKEKRSLAKGAWALERIDPFIGHLALENVHMGTLRPYIEYGHSQAWKGRTTNSPLEVVRHILNLAASEWLDEYGLSWLQSAPKIRLLSRKDARKPYPLSAEEQKAIFDLLPGHLLRMCVFAVNTGCRNQEICGLMRNDEILVPEMNTSVFLLPEDWTKNGEERLIVLNSLAKVAVDEARGQHPTWVFSYKGKRLQTMLTTAWKEARR